MADLVNLAAESGRDIIGDDNTPTLKLENQSTSPNANAVGLEAVHTGSGAGTATVAALRAINSAASGAALEFAGACIVSCLSGGSIFAGVRVKWGNAYKWIPLMDNLGNVSAP